MGESKSTAYVKGLVEGVDATMLIDSGLGLSIPKRVNEYTVHFCLCSKWAIVGHLRYSDPSYTVGW